MIFRYANIAENKIYSRLLELSDPDWLFGLGPTWKTIIGRCAFFDYAMLYGWIP
jgi:hypothetical protein